MSPSDAGDVKESFGPERGQLASPAVTLSGPILDHWGEPPRKRRDAKWSRESVTIVRPSELPGIEMQQIRNSERKWTIYHSSFDFCSSTRVSGGIEWRYRNQTSPMAPDLIGVLVPGEMHRVTHIEGDSDYLLLLIEPGAMARFLKDDETRLLYSVRPQLDGRRYCSKLAELWEAMTDRVHDTMRVESLLSEFLSAITQTSNQRDPSSQPRNVNTRIVRDYLHDNYNRNVTLDECAKLTGTSKFHLHRSFVAELGVPPHQYLSAIRISRARDLLRRGTRPADVAGMTGFCDQSHLTRVFTEVVGLTPGAYAAQFPAH